MNGRFSGKTVIVTGASGGIGAACARQFAAEDARLVLAARSRDKLDSLAEELGGERAIAVPTDVGVRKQLTHLLETAKEQFGRVDVVVNNAGFNHRGAVEHVAERDLSRMVRINLEAPILLSKLALPYLQDTGGAIVNVTSVAGQIPLPDEATYSATKAALRAFTRALSEELRESPVRVSMVSPGPVETGFILNDLEEVPDMVFAQPMSSPDDIAEQVVESAKGGKTERTLPRMSGYMATLGYLFPALPRLLAPTMAKRGRETKARYRRDHSA